MNWKWQKADWVFIIGSLMSALLGCILWIVESDPNPESVRYLLSTIPQVTGTIFVIVIAFMQLLGNLPLPDFIKRPEFIITSLVSLVGIISPLIILYLEEFCRFPTIALSVGFWNLTIIGWFIIRVVPAQAISKLPKTLETETTDSLVSTAIESLRLNARTTACKMIQELAKRAEDEIAKDEFEELTVSRLFENIHGIATHRNNIFEEVWNTATHSLVELNKLVHEKQLVDLTHTLNSYIASFPVRYGRTKGAEWNTIKLHFFKCFHEDLFSDLDKHLGKRRIELERAKSHEFKDSDYLNVMCSLLLAASATRRHDIEGALKKYVEIQDKIIDEFTVAIKNPILSEHYTPVGVFKLLLFIIIDGLRWFGKEQDKDYLDYIDEKLLTYAEAARKNFRPTLDDSTHVLNFFLELAKKDDKLMNYRVKTTGLGIEHYQGKIQEFQRRIQEKMSH